ncbi:hypothetical protein L3X38_040393 [Prunus dulcis]|uniref:Uncharacterized protein n=1 Tax=Prunus dulcis TaxID=3755 RepID=A0AAD4V8Z0_PRUDU|nr:hypothetical protein L3X38_040393 [Prunus dulcis]
MEVVLVGLLRTAWIAVILPLFIVSVPSSRLSSSHGAVLEFPKRGKIMKSSSQSKSYGDSRTYCKSKSPLSGSGGKVNAGYDAWKLSSNGEEA